VQEEDGVWPRTGVFRHVSYSTPLVIPYQSAGARERTPRPKTNRACTPPLSPLPGSFRTEGTGLPIRDCTGSYNSSVKICSRVNAIDVIDDINFERLYLVSG